MSQGVEKIRSKQGVVDDLEPYHRLIELQKQTIDLIKQREKAKLECDMIRAQLTRQMTASSRLRSNFQPGKRKADLRLFKKVALFGNRVKKTARSVVSFLS